MDKLSKVIELKSNFVMHNQKCLLAVCLAVTFLIWLVPFLIGQDAAIFTGDLFYIPLSVLLVMVSIYRVIYTSEKTARIMWILFTASSFATLVAEHIWSLDELILGTKPFPSYADVGYLLTDLLLIPFFIMFVLPLKHYISKKMIALAICISISIVISNAYILIQSDAGIFTIENTLLSAYPILDGIIFFPASIGIMLFFKRKTNFFPSMMFFAMLSMMVGDILFQITDANGTYYTGSITELFFYFPFVLFMFGAYDLHQLGKKEDVSVRNT